MNNILFVHIPKNGGTSILEKIDQSMWIKKFHAGHDPFFAFETNNGIKKVDNSFSFCVVRNPYTRTLSYFNHFKRINQVECSFIEFLYILKTKKYYPKTQMMIYPQSFYVYNSNGNIGVKKIFYFEKFYEIEEELGIKFNKLNKGNYKEKDYENFYSDKKCIELVDELFSVDFINFNYEFGKL